jgi:hypothetical protein
MTNPKPVVKVDKITRKIVASYPSTAAAERANNTSQSTIKQACSKKMLSHGRYYYRYAADFDPNEVFKSNHGSPIVVFDVEMKQSMFFYSINDVCKAFFVGAGGVKWAIEKKKLYLGRYYVSFETKRINTEQEGTKE